MDRLDWRFLPDDRLKNIDGGHFAILSGWGGKRGKSHMGKSISVPKIGTFLVVCDFGIFPPHIFRNVFWISIFDVFNFINFSNAADGSDFSFITNFGVCFNH